MKDRQWKDNNKLINSMVLLRISLIIFKNMFFNSKLVYKILFLQFLFGFFNYCKKTFFSADFGHARPELLRKTDA